MVCHFHILCPGLGVIFDCIDSFSLPSSLPVVCNLPILCPGLGVVFDCIDSFSLLPCLNHTKLI